MRRPEAAAYLGITQDVLGGLIHSCSFVNEGCGRYHIYTPEELQILKRVIDARKELKEAKLALSKYYHVTNQQND